ncbi:MAG: 2TM domain-containing protein, partial [Bacteroidia bacterium]|nr:2TM domain-containing protein [Bacteroidia bacterium]
MEENRDERLWKLARKRASFKRNIITYMWVNVLLWCIWWFSRGRHGSYGFPWPAWVTIFWGLGIVLEYFKLYGYNEEDLAEKEYEKLK